MGSHVFPVALTVSTTSDPTDRAYNAPARVATFWVKREAVTATALAFVAAMAPPMLRAEFRTNVTLVALSDACAPERKAAPPRLALLPEKAEETTWITLLYTYTPPPA